MPVSVEGWLALGLFCVGVGLDVAVLIYPRHIGTDQRAALTAFFVWLAVFLVGLFAICFMTGEGPRWRWGD